MAAAAATEEDMSVRVEESLRRRFAEQRERGRAYGSEFDALWQTAADHALGGKLVRPRLLLDVHQALVVAPSASSQASAVDVATQIELLHYAFLLHDDVIDGDLIRRSRPNLIGSLNARDRGATPEASLHWSRSSGLLMGDLMLTASIMGFARADLSPDVRDALLDLVQQTIIETVAGELTDVALSDGVISPDLPTILDMSVYKTATYSFALPLRAAALLAGSSPQADSALARVGRHLGLAYQLQDDLLCVFGDPVEHGKDAFSDIRERKETAIIAFARGTQAWPAIRALFADQEITAQTALTIRDQLRSCGAEDFIVGLIGDQLDSVYSVVADAERSGQISADAARAILRSVSHLEGRRA